jgi:hypothetical protein
MSCAVLRWDLLLACLSDDVGFNVGLLGCGECATRRDIECVLCSFVVRTSVHKSASLEVFTQPDWLSQYSLYRFGRGLTCAYRPRHGTHDYRIANKTKITGNVRQGEWYSSVATM